jgi:hypothetical protein
MPQRIAEFAPLFTLLSALVSLLSLAVAFVAFRRTSKLQDVDYRPHLSLTVGEPFGCVELDKEEDDDEEVKRQQSLEALFQGRITNAGPKPIYLVHAHVSLGPRHRDDPERVMKVPFYKTLGAGAECSFDFGLQWGTIWDVARHFHRTAIECHLAISVRGADGVTREVGRYVGTAMECEGTEWIFIEPRYFLEVLNDLQQARLRRKLRPEADQGSTSTNPDN